MVPLNNVQGLPGNLIISFLLLIPTLSSPFYGEFKAFTQPGARQLRPGLASLGATAGNNTHSQVVRGQFLPFDSTRPVWLKHLPNNTKCIPRWVSGSYLSLPGLWLSCSLGPKCAAIFACLAACHHLWEA